MEVRKIRTIFHTVQAQISNLKNQDHEIHRNEEQVDWTSGPWSDYSLLDLRIATDSMSKVYVFSDSVLCLGGNCHDHLEAARTWENDRIREFVQTPECRPYYDIAGKRAEIAWEILEWIKNMLEEGLQPAQVQDRIIMFLYSDIVHRKITVRTYVVTMQSVRRKLQTRTLVISWSWK